jgi:hypothetical protein
MLVQCRVQVVGLHAHTGNVASGGVSAAMLVPVLDAVADLEDECTHLAASVGLDLENAPMESGSGSASEDGVAQPTPLPSSTFFPNPSPK